MVRRRRWGQRNTGGRIRRFRKKLDDYYSTLPLADRLVHAFLRGGEVRGEDAEKREGGGGGSVVGGD